jgi:hypothetical protein
LKWSRSHTAIESGCPWRREPRALGDELLLELLGARRGLDAGEHLAVGDGLEQVVLDAAAQAGQRVVGRQRRPLDHHDRGRVGDGVGLDVAHDVGAALGVQQRDVGRPGAAALERLLALGDLDHVVPGRKQQPSDPAPLRTQGMGQQHPHVP